MEIADIELDALVQMVHRGIGYEQRVGRILRTVSEMYSSPDNKWRFSTVALRYNERMSQAASDLMDRAATVEFLRKSGPRFYTLEGIAELRRSHAYRPPKYLSKMARTSVADFECDFDEASGCFADQLLSLQHALSSQELDRRHTRGLLEHAREMERTQLPQFSQRRD